jgi:hypothetical protein
MFDRAPRRRYGVMAFAGYLSISAYFGAGGLISGLLPIDARMSANLPLHSPVFAGLALAAIVGLPSSTVVWLAARGDRRTATAATVAGVLLVGWIAVELAIVREFSVLQVLYTAAGLVLIAVGGRSGWRSVIGAGVALPASLSAGRHR